MHASGLQDEGPCYSTIRGAMKSALLTLMAIVATANGFGVNAPPRNSVIPPASAHQRIVQVSMEVNPVQKFIGDVISLRILDGVREKLAEDQKKAKEEAEKEKAEELAKQNPNSEE